MKLGHDMIIVCATDFSDPSKAALDAALSVARGLAAAGLRLLYVDETTAHIAATSDARFALELERIQDEARAKLEALAKERAAASGLAVTPVFRPGSAGHEIVRYAREALADLLVVGSHGRTGLRRILVGSIAENVLRHAPCDVLVVRAEAHASASR